MVYIYVGMSFIYESPNTEGNKICVGYKDKNCWIQGMCMDIQVTKALVTYRNNQQVQDVPCALEVGPFKCPDLYGLLNDVVKDEEHKDALTSQHKEVVRGDIA